MSLGLRIPERCSIARSFFLHHSWMAKCWMSMCRAWGVGCFSLITWRAATLSMNECVGPGQRASSAVTTQQRHLAIFQLCFSQTGGNHSLDATLPCNCSKAEEHNKSSCGAAGLEVGGVGCIEAVNQLILEDEGERRKIGIFFSFNAQPRSAWTHSRILVIKSSAVSGDSAPNAKSSS